MCTNSKLYQIEADNLNFTPKACSHEPPLFFVKIYETFLRLTVFAALLISTVSKAPKTNLFNQCNVINELNKVSKKICFRRLTHFFALYYTMYLA